MTTQIDIDGDLINQAMQISGQHDKQAVVEQALEEFVRFHEQQSVEDNPAEQTELIARTKRGYEDIDAGRVCDGRTIMRELAKKHGLTPPR